MQQIEKESRGQRCQRRRSEPAPATPPHTKQKKKKRSSKNRYYTTRIPLPLLAERAEPELSLPSTALCWLLPSADSSQPARSDQKQTGIVSKYRVERLRLTTHQASMSNQALSFHMWVACISTNQHVVISKDRKFKRHIIRCR